MSVDTTVRSNLLRGLRDRIKKHSLPKLGAGLITGVADDDPSGIATYSQAGAQFGVHMLWTMPVAFPLMAAVQLMCATLGRVTGKGLAANIKTAFPPAVLYGVVLLLLLANTLNIAADVAAIGECAELVTGVDRHLMAGAFVIATLLLQVLVPYHRYVFFLKWLTVSLLAYAAVLFTVHVPWRQVALGTLWPSFTPNATAAAVVVGIFGTTISPYLFFWQGWRARAPMPFRKPWVGRHREHARRPRVAAFVDQPHEGAVLVRGHQRRRFGAANGRHHDSRVQALRDGGLYGEPHLARARMGRDGGHERGGAGHVRSALKGQDCAATDFTSCYPVSTYSGLRFPYTPIATDSFARDARSIDTRELP